MNHTAQNEVKLECDYTLPEYWKKHCHEIAAQRSWKVSKNAKGEVVCKTMTQYNGYIQKLCPCLSETHTISTLTIFDLQKAIEQVQKTRRDEGKEYMPFLADMIERTPENISAESHADMHITLYVLRRNFWTFLQGGTLLTDFEKRYLMGHEIDINRQDMRKMFNNETILWSIYLKFMLYKINLSLRDDEKAFVLGNVLYIENSGRLVVYIFPTEELEGKKLCIRALSLEPGSSITLKLDSPQYWAGKGIKLHDGISKIRSFSDEHIFMNEKLNCELSIHNALVKSTHQNPINTHFKKNAA